MIADDDLVVIERRETISSRGFCRMAATRCCARRISPQRRSLAASLRRRLGRSLTAHRPTGIRGLQHAGSVSVDRLCCILRIGPHLRPASCDAARPSRLDCVSECASGFRNPPVSARPTSSGASHSAGGPRASWGSTGSALVCNASAQPEHAGRLNTASAFDIHASCRGSGYARISR